MAHRLAGMGLSPQSPWDGLGGKMAWGIKVTLCLQTVLFYALDRQPWGGELVATTEPARRLH